MNKFFRKYAAGKGGSAAGSFMKGTGKAAGATAGFISAELMPYLIGASGLSAVLGALALAKASSPEAIADNADDILINDTMKSSLAKSMRDRDRLLMNQSKTNIRLPKHDQFI